MRAVKQVNCYAVFWKVCRSEMSQQGRSYVGRNEEILQSDVESAFKVLEYLRDEWPDYPQSQTLMNGAHCALQAFVNDHDIGSAPEGTVVDINGAPQEAIDYAFDQLEATSVNKLIMGYRHPFSSEINYDYDNGQLAIQGRSPVEEILVNAMDEKLRDMLYEVRHNERDDYAASELREARRKMQTNLSRRE